MSEKYTKLMEEVSDWASVLLATIVIIGCIIIWG